MTARLTFKYTWSSTLPANLDIYAIGPNGEHHGPGSPDTTSTGPGEEDLTIADPAEGVWRVRSVASIAPLPTAAHVVATLAISLRLNPSPPASACTGTLLLPGVPEPSVGRGPFSVTSGDFNGDGKLDLVTASSRDNNVSVLLGNGDGTFQAAVNYSVGAFSVTSGDFNGDGKLDLVVAGGPNNVSVLLGNGDGTFQAAVTYSVGPVGTSPFSVMSGDFNGDGTLDLVAANTGSNNVSVLLGNGDGTFQAAVSYPAGSGPRSVTSGDFNGDGKLDLAVTWASQSGASSGVSVLLGNGDGTFQAAVGYSVGPFGTSTPFSVTTGDFNGDENLDLVTANNS